MHRHLLQLHFHPPTPPCNRHRKSLENDYQNHQVEGNDRLGTDLLKLRRRDALETLPLTGPGHERAGASVVGEMRVDSAGEDGSEDSDEKA